MGWLAAPRRKNGREGREASGNVAVPGSPFGAMDGPLVFPRVAMAWDARAAGWNADDSVGAGPSTVL